MPLPISMRGNIDFRDFIYSFNCFCVAFCFLATGRRRKELFSNVYYRGVCFILAIPGFAYSDGFDHLHHRTVYSLDDRDNVLVKIETKQS